MTDSFDNRAENKVEGKGSVINDRYFSGVQTSMFIGDTWVDDIVELNYRVSHNRSPVYGYGSQHFDFVPKGTILVEGNFTVNFREPNYLWMILANYASFNAPTGQINEDGRLNTIANPSKEERIQGLSGLSDSFPNDPRRNLDAFLGVDSGSANAVKDRLSSKLSQKQSTNRRAERFNHGIFAITMGYGELNQDTVGQRINFVQIMGSGKTITIDGRPVMETYSFIARDIS